MQQQEIADRTRFIMNSGKRVWEWVFQIQTRQLSEFKDKKFGNTLSMGQYQLLLLVHKQEYITISALAAGLGVSKPSVSAMVDRLVERGVLRRSQSREDRRKVEIFLTEEALEQVREIEAVLFNSFLRLVDRIGPDVARQWCDVLGYVEQCLPEREE
ncbi:MAG: MarR family transcriptional regulator [Desulfohalobiaceae bacterium]|nr:MarR family transcriptional regulator [Desulfohalobiaceae bacterium]